MAINPIRLAKEVAKRFGYGVSTAYGMKRDFRRLEDPAVFFFRVPDRSGRPPPQLPEEVRKRLR